MNARNLTLFSEHRDLVEDYKEKNNRQLFLRTSSPSLIIDPIPNITTEYLDNSQQKVINKLIKRISPTCQRIFRFIKKKIL